MLDIPGLRGALHRAGRRVMMQAAIGLVAGSLAVAGGVFALLAAYLGLRPVFGPAGAAAFMALGCLAVAALTGLALKARSDAVPEPPLPAPVLTVAHPQPQPDPALAIATGAFTLAFVLARRLRRR